MSKASSSSYGVRRIDTQIADFARIFGVRSNDMATGSEILPRHEDSEDRLGNINADQGAIMDPACVAGLYWDVDHYDPPGSDLLDEISVVPVEAHPHGHNGVPAVTFKTDRASTTVSADYLDKAEEMYGYDPRKAFGMVRLHGSLNAPMKVMDRYGESFVLIAPRVRRDD